MCSLVRLTIFLLTTKIISMIGSLLLRFQENFGLNSSVGKFCSLFPKSYIRWSFPPYHSNFFSTLLDIYYYLIADTLENLSKVSQVEQLGHYMTRYLTEDKLLLQTYRYLLFIIYDSKYCQKFSQVILWIIQHTIYLS